MPDLMLLRGARQLLTLHGSKEARRGFQLQDLGIIPDGAMLIRDGVIDEVGPSRRVENLAAARGAREVDATGAVVMPGFVDSHTHLIYGSTWLKHYEERLAGAAALDAASDLDTGIHAIRTASSRRLEYRARLVVADMLRHGTTTCEAKSGFAYDQGEELKVLRALSRLDGDPMDVARTYLAGLPVPHNDETLPCPLEHARTDTLPRVAERKLARFADVFLDGRGCGVDQTRRYLESARDLGFLLKLHADQFCRAGGVALAVEMGAASADHVNWAGEEEIAMLARSSTIATLVPGASFHPGGPRLAPARTLIGAGAAVALASGFSPYGCPGYNMQMIVSLACARLHMTPAEALSAATINGAHAIRQADSCGSLEIGKRADFIVLNVSDYREIPYFFGVNAVRMTVKRGKIVYRQGEVK